MKFFTGSKPGCLCLAVNMRCYQHRLERKTQASGYLKQLWSSVNGSTDTFVELIQKLLRKLWINIVQSVASRRRSIQQSFSAESRDFEKLHHLSAMITNLDNDFIESIIEKYGNKLLKINLSNNGKTVSFVICNMSQL